MCWFWAEKIWKSSGYYDSHWAPLKKGSMKLEDWRIKKYNVYVMERSEDFGSTSDACDGFGLC